MTHPGPFLYVSLTLGFFGFHHREIEFWPRLLASKRVQHLVWVNRPPPMDLPMSAGMLRCSNLQSLYIGFWKLPEMSAPYHHQRASPHLMKLVIGHCLVDSRNLELILKHSPSLLTLSFVSCYRTPRTVEIQRNSTISNIVFWCSMVDVLPVVDLPCMNRHILWNATSVSANTQMTVKMPASLTYKCSESLTYKCSDTLSLACTSCKFGCFDKGVDNAEPNGPKCEGIGLKGVLQGPKAGQDGTSVLEMLPKCGHASH